jgi:hypothetical protein
MNDHPDPEELASYHAGALAPAEEKRIQDHLLLCQDCSETLFDIARFADPQDDGAGLPAGLADAVWEGVASQIRPTVVPFPQRAASSGWAPRRPRALTALAAALLAATIGLSVWVASLRRTVDELSRPQVNAPVIDLYSGAVRGEGAAAVRAIPRDARVFTLILTPASAHREKEYRVEVVRADGSRAWSEAGLTPNTYGSLSLTLTRRTLGAGDFRIRLYGGESLIAEYALRVEGP